MSQESARDRFTPARLDEGDVLDRVVKSAAELIGARAAALWVADDRLHMLSLRAWSDEALGRDWAPRALAYGAGGIGAVAVHRRLEDRDDVIEDTTFLPSEFREWARRHGLPSMVAAPVALGGELLAVLTLWSPRPFGFGRDEQAMVGTFTALAAATIAAGRAHHEALRDRDFHRSVAEHAAEAIIATDAAGRVMYMNAGAETMFECEASRMLGCDIRTLALHGEVEPAVIDAIATHLRKREDVAHQDLTFARPSGATLEATMSVHQLPTRHGEPAGRVFVVRDVTELRATRRSLQQTERLSVMGLLVAGVAHELSNPLQVVAGYADLLKASTTQQPRVASHAEQIHRAAGRCLRIVDNFLALARRRPQGREAVHVNTVVHDALDLLAHQLRLDGIEVTLDLATELPEVWGDPHELHQVLVNLIANARHAMRRAEEPRQLRLSTRTAAGGARVVVEVADSGPGVPPALRERIFEPFFTTAAPGEGTGLGLPLCQSIAVAHGGTISLAPSLGSGATFIVDLPARDPEPSTERGSAPAADVTPSQRVLVVDDEREVAALVAAFLDIDGHEPHVESDVESALARLREMPFGVVLVDAHLPGMDALALLRRVDEIAPELVRRVIFMTGDSITPGGLLEEHDLPSLTKPFGREALRAAIARVVND